MRCSSNTGPKIKTIESAEMAPKSTQSYLNFVKTEESRVKGKAQQIVGINSVNIKEGEGGQIFYELKLSKVLRGIDYLIIRNKNQGYELIVKKDFGVLEYDRQTHLLLISLADKNLKLPTGKRVPLEISIDLTRLIANVGDYFDENGVLIGSPCITPTIATANGYQYAKEFNHPALKVLNEEQKNAVDTIMRKPLVYIFGPPGTGKSGAVLSTVAARYLMQESKIAIICPTNIATERAAEAILEIVDAMGMDRSVVLRLGHPSRAFAYKYPEAIEHINFLDFIEDEGRDYYHLFLALEYRKVVHIIKKKESLIIAEMLLVELKTLAKEILKSDDNDIVLDSKRKMFQFKVSTLQHSIQDDEIRAILEDLLLSNVDAVYTAFMEVQAGINVIIDTTLMAPITKEEEKVLRALQLKPSQYETRQQMFEEVIGSRYDNLSDLELKRNFNGLLESMENVIERRKKERFARAKVLLMTFDTYLTQYEKEPLMVKHLFIDEAGYVPAVKALAVARPGIPLTLFGDHFQLPPINELNDSIKHKEYEDVFMFTQSAVHLERYLYESHEEAKGSYFSDAEPIFNNMVRVDLTKTYRFGSNLATVLDKFVYKNGFTSMLGKEEELELLAIDAVNGEVEKRRENHAEAMAIKHYLEASDDTSDIAILTPYLPQVSYLKKTLRGLIDLQQISTIHAAQGQEFGTLIFSIVDDCFSGGDNSVWYTNSKNKKIKALEIINTAVSRAKSRLVLVGNAKFWMDHPEQLLGELFITADKIKLNQHGSTA